MTLDNIKLKSSRKRVKNSPTHNVFMGWVFILGGARNLLPLGYERPESDIRPKRSKTGKNREFLQKMAFWGNFYTTQTRTRLQIFGILPYSTQKFPTKITGNFLEPNRDLSANNRELYFSPHSTQNKPKCANITQL